MKSYTYIPTPAQKVNLTSPAPKEVEVPVPEKKELSSNIKKYDTQVSKKVFTSNPYDYNSISLKKNYTPAPTEAITDPTINAAAKAVGADTVHGWSKDYPHVVELVEWARKNTKEENISSWLYQQMNKAPNLTGRRINDLYAYMKLGGSKQVVAKKKPKQPTVDKITDFLRDWM